MKVMEGGNVTSMGGGDLARSHYVQVANSKILVPHYFEVRDTDIFIGTQGLIYDRPIEVKFRPSFLKGICLIDSADRLNEVLSNGFNYHVALISRNGAIRASEIEVSDISDIFSGQLSMLSNLADSGSISGIRNILSFLNHYPFGVIQKDVEEMARGAVSYSFSSDDEYNLILVLRLFSSFRSVGELEMILDHISQKALKLDAVVLYYVFRPLFELTELFLERYSALKVISEKGGRISQDQVAYKKLSREFMAQALLEVLNRKGLSVRKAAEVAGVSASVISTIKDQSASIDKSLDVLRALGYEVDCTLKPDAP